MRYFLLLFILIGNNGFASGQDLDSIKDTRDNQKYSIIKIGSQVWMSENLNYSMEGTFVYENKQANAEVYGRLYIWSSALKSCPSGWHLPTSEEWDKMINFLGGVNSAGKYLSQSVNGNNSDDESHKNNFNSIPSGYRDPFGNYGNLEEFAYYWTATEGDSLTAIRRIVSEKGLSIGAGYGNKTSAYSVRCIKD